MTKEELKKQILDLIDSLEEDELDEFSDIIKEYQDELQIANNLVLINGELKKITKSIQLLSNNISKNEQDLEKNFFEPFILMYNFLNDSVESLSDIPNPTIFNKKAFIEKFSSFKAGFNSIEKVYNQILNKINLTPTAKKKMKFDPDLHEAVEVINNKKIPDNIIVEVLEQGFKTNNLVIKYAKVKVNKWI